MEVNKHQMTHNHNNDKTNINNLVHSPGYKPLSKTREDSYDRAQKDHISQNIQLTSLASFSGRANQSPILSPSPVTMIPSPYTTQSIVQADESDEILAIQALGQLKNSETPPPQGQPQTTTRDELIEDDEDDEDEFYDTSNDIDAMSGVTGSSQQLLSSADAAATGFIMRNIKSHPLYNSAIRAYRINKPTIKYGVEMVERAAIPMVNMVEQTRLEWKRKKRLRRANAMFPDEAKFLPYKTSSLLSSTALYSKNSPNLPSISEALALGNKNFNEFSLNLSIESKKRIATCLQLLMLANKQISSKIQHLQDLIAKEQEFLKVKKEAKKQDNDEKIELVAQEEEETNTTTVQIKQEIITTVKKVVSLISKYAGNSLPEPARSNVRETLLRLPTKWASNSCTTTTSITTPATTTSSSSSSSIFNTNGKVLILANESLEMVSSVMSVFDETLAKAELWVKQKQEKQLAKAAILNNLHYSNTQLRSSTTPSSGKEQEQQEQEVKEEVGERNGDDDQQLHP